MVTVGPLTTQQRRTIKQVQRRAVGQVSQRAHMVLLSARGYSVAQIAGIFEVGEDTVRTWMQRYQQEGADGLADRPRPGRPPRDRLARQVIEAQVAVPSTRLGWCRAIGRWRCWLRCWRCAMGCTCRPEPCGGSCMPAAGAGGDPGSRRPPTRRASSARRIRQVLAGAATVLYLDECELQLLPLVRAMWMRGERVRIPSPGQNAKRVLEHLTKPRDPRFSE